MFQDAAVFNQDIRNWNVSNVTTMYWMFANSTSFDQNIGSWNISGVTDFANFMYTKTPSTFSTANLNAIYNGWSTKTPKTSILISFGTAKHTSESTAGKLVLTSTPYNWSITDGGI